MTTSDVILMMIKIIGCSYKSQRWTPQIFFLPQMENSAKFWGSFRYRKSAIFLDVQHFFRVCKFADCDLRNLFASRSLLIRAQQKSMSHQTLVQVSTEIKGLNKKCRTILAFHSFSRLILRKCECHS
jgi:hypothetical protein